MRIVRYRRMMRDRFSRCGAVGAAGVMLMFACCVQHVGGNENRMRGGGRIAADRDEGKRKHQQQGNQRYPIRSVLSCPGRWHRRYSMTADRTSVCMKYRILFAEIQPKMALAGHEVRS